MTRLVELGLALKLEAQGVDSGNFDQLHSIDVVAQSLRSRKPDLTSRAAPDGTVTLMFSDMQGFTPMTESVGDLRFGDSREVSLKGISQSQTVVDVLWE